MRVVCIDSGYGHIITYGKSYEVISDGSSFICIIDNDGKRSNYGVDVFIPQSEFRNKIIENILK